MSLVIAAPEMMTSAATDLATIGSDVNAAHMVAAAPTVALVPAAADEVSAGIAHLFSQYGAEFQALAGKATAFHEQFVQHLTASAHSYAATEAANTASLRPLTASAGSLASPTAALSSPLLNSLLTDFRNFSAANPQLTTALVDGLLILFWPITLPAIILWALVVSYLVGQGL